MTLSLSWTETIDKAKADAKWDDYDALIKLEVSSYSTRLKLVAADWRVFKAQVWTETGAANAGWGTRPIQIGNPGDPAYKTLKTHKENSSLIMSEQVRRDLANGRSVDDPKFNVQLGLVYAYTKLSTFQSVVLDLKILSYEVKSGDSIEKIATVVGSTKQNLLDLNPKVGGTIFPKQKLNYQKAEIQPTGFSVTAMRLQIYYNGNGDPHYAEKIDYCMDVINKLKR